MHAPTDDPREAMRRFADLAMTAFGGIPTERRDIPDEMFDGHCEGYPEYFCWKPIPSTVRDADLDAIERSIGLALPPLYREFLQYKHFIQVECMGACFGGLLPGVWREELELFFNAARDRTLDRGLIPFASERWCDAGYFCFDTRRRAPDGDCAVVMWDWDRVGDPHETWEVCSSSRALFRCLDFAWRNRVDWQNHSHPDPIEELRRQRALAPAFIALDPEVLGEHEAWWYPRPLSNETPGHTSRT